MTRQEMFNKAYFGVIQQGAKSMKDNERCAYYGLNGSKCGVGHLIDDATAKRWDKRKDAAITDILANKKLKIPEWMLGEESFLHDLQWAHDCSGLGEDFIEGFKKRMKAVAVNNRLTMPKEDAM